MNTLHWAAILADAAAKGMVVMLLAGVAALLLRRSSAAVRHMAWTLSLAALLVVPLFSLALPQFQVPLLPDWARPVGAEQAEPSAPAAAAEVPAEPVALERPLAPPADLPSEPTLAAVEIPQRHHEAQESGRPAVLPAPIAAGAPAPSVQRPSVHWSAWVCLAWLGGAALLLLPLLAGTAIVWRQTRRAQRIGTGSWPLLLDELRGQLGIRGPVVLLQSNWSNIPVTCGILRPTIILPAEADNWPADRRKVVLLHELAHVRRADCLTQLLARVARVLYWFNPLVWLAARMQRIEREQACDDRVLSSGHKASEYAQHLLDIVRSLRSARCPSLAAVAMARRSHFEGRLLAILDTHRNRRGLTGWGVLLAACLVASAVIPLACVQVTSDRGTAKSLKNPIHQEVAQSGRIRVHLVIEPQNTRDALKMALEDLKLASQPLLTDTDFREYDGATSRLQLTNEGLDKLPTEVGVWGVPFVVIADGQRWYMGSFYNLDSSYRPEVPTTTVRLGVMAGDGGLLTPEAKDIDPDTLDALQSIGQKRSLAAISTQPAGDAPVASVELPGSPVDLGQSAFQAMGKQNLQAMQNLASGDMSLTYLAELLTCVNAPSLRLQHVYVDGDQAILIGSPLAWTEMRYKPVVLNLQARRTASGWSITSWRKADSGDNGIFRDFLWQHPKAEHAYDAPPPAPPPGGRMFALRVVDADTKDALSDVVIIVRADGEQYTVFTDGEGIARIPLAAGRPASLPSDEPRLWLEASRLKYVSMRYTPSDSLPDSFTLPMPPGKTIGGTLKNEQGQPIAGADVLTWPEFQQPASPISARQSGHAITDQQGRWQLDDVSVATRDVFVRIVHPDHIIDRRWHDAGPMAGLYDQTNVMVLQQSHITVSGTVYGPDGKPLAGAQIRQGRNRFGTQFPVAKTDAAGRYEFRHTPPGELVLFVITPNCSPELTVVEAAKDMEPVDFHLSAGKAIRGRVVDSSGKPIGDVQVNVDTWRGRETLNWRAKTDSDGRFQWNVAPADAVMMRFAKAGHPTVTKAVTPSEEEQTFTLSAAEAGGF